MKTTLSQKDKKLKQEFWTGFIFGGLLACLLFIIIYLIIK